MARCASKIVASSALIASQPVFEPPGSGGDLEDCLFQPVELMADLMRAMVLSGIVFSGINEHDCPLAYPPETGMPLNFRSVVFATSVRPNLKRGNFGILFRFQESNLEML